MKSYRKAVVLRHLRDESFFILRLNCSGVCRNRFAVCFFALQCGIFFNYYM